MPHELGRREREVTRGVWGEDGISAVLVREHGSPVSLTQLQWRLRVGETEKAYWKHQKQNKTKIENDKNKTHQHS